jgi:chemotaxis signal transduction protein
MRSEGIIEASVVMVLHRGRQTVALLVTKVVKILEKEFEQY